MEYALRELPSTGGKLLLRGNVADGVTTVTVVFGAGRTNPEPGILRFPGSAGIVPAAGRRPVVVRAGTKPVLPGKPRHASSVRGEASPGCRIDADGPFLD